MDDERFDDRHNNKELQKTMLAIIPTMPNKAKRVAEYLLTNMREAAFRSIGDVADELHVSKAQMVRVARMLGFNGYAELKDSLQSAILEQVNPVAMLAKSVDEQNEMPHMILQMERANLDETWAMLDSQKLTEFCELVVESTHTCCLGWGISSLVTEMLYMRLSVLGLPASLCKRGSLALTEQTRYLKKGHLLLICELPSYAIDVTDVAARAHEKGCKIVAIADSPVAPVCRFADLTFTVSAASPTFGSSTIGPIFLAHLLSSSLAIHMGEAAKIALQEQADFLHDERTFHPIFGLKY